MSTLSSLRKLASLSDLATFLGFKPSALAYIIYKIPDEAKYTCFSVKKASGGEREIYSPDPRLKLLQQKLATTLNECLKEIESQNGHSTPLSHGFKKHLSTITNAKKHRKQRYVFNIDIKDFFPSINFGRVRGYFISNHHFELDAKVATVISQIACYKNTLPQGAPTSPVISNLIGHILDVRLLRIAKANNCYYTRYADDITFSTSKKKFPTSIAISDESHNWKPSDKISSIISRAGFSINSKKTRMLYCRSQQEVTGLVVNKKVNVPVDYRKSVRAMVRSLIMKGSFHIPVKIYDESIKKTIIKNNDGSIDQLHGMLSYIDHVNLVNKNGHISDPHSEINPKGKKKSSFEKDFTNFLFYKYFYAPTKPLILCEGKTDNIYLKHAIRSLHEQYPQLASTKDKKVTLQIDFFKYSRDTGGDSQKSRLLSLKGGTGDLANFIGKYKSFVDEIAAPGKIHPVIIIVDHDEGCDKIFSAMKEHLKEKVDGSKCFYHLCHNLYAVVLPKINGKKDTMIEDYFPTRTRNIQVGGKTFKPTNGPVGKKNYGKHIFANKVVAPNSKKIDFSNFKPILDRITLAIKDYKTKH